jgi:hypothetical protein
VLVDMCANTIENYPHQMIRLLANKSISLFIRPSLPLGGVHVVIVGHRELWHSTYSFPFLFVLFEKFDGGREDRTLNPMRVHGNARIINPGHYRSCYPAVEDWQGRRESNPRASVGETFKGSPTPAASLTVRWFRPLTHAPAGAT